MKNFLSLLVFLLIFSATGFAQSGMQIGKVGFSFSPMVEAYGVSSFDNILDLAKNKEEVVRDLSAFEGDFTAGIAGTYAGLQFMLTPKKANRALLINASLALGKEMFVSSIDDPGIIDISGPSDVSTVGTPPNPGDIQVYQYPTAEEAAYCVVENEFRVDATWVHYKNLGRHFTLYGGFGGAVGATYNNDFIVMGSERIEGAAIDEPQFRELNETYESRNSILGRAHVYGGVGFRASKHYEIALEGKQGLGVQKAFGGPTDFIKMSGIYGLSIRYVL